MIIKLLALNPSSWDLRSALSDRSICLLLFSSQSCDPGRSSDLIVHSIFPSNVKRERSQVERLNIYRQNMGESLG